MAEAGSGDTTAVSVIDPTAPVADGEPRKRGTVGLDPVLGLPHRDATRYQVEAEHARGGIGRILRAYDVDLDRKVAVKELMAERPSDRARFAREVRLTARLEHPGIVPVHDAGQRDDGGRPYYTMKLVGGDTLRDVVAHATTFEERLALIRHGLAVADAVAYAHSQGIIHRDLKPSNVMVGEFGETIVIDWGLAKEIDAKDLEDDARPIAGRDEVTVVGTIIGTPAFMAPEQARGETVDARADVYALGAILYHTVTGSYPYQADSGADALKLLLAGPPPPVREREPRVPIDLAAIIDKAMTRDPAARYPSARELAGDLRQYDAGRRVGARHYRWWEPPVRWVMRHRMISALVVAFLISGTAGLLIALRREQRLRGVAERERAGAIADRQTLFEQQARQEMAAGRPHRAAPYLAAALRVQPERRVLRWLGSQVETAMRSHVTTLHGHTRDVVSVAFSPDGKTLASGATDKTVRLWDTATGAPRGVLTGNERSIEQVTWSPDGALLASCDGKGVRVWKADGTLVHALAKGGYRCAFTGDGKQLWVGYHDGHIRIWDITSGALIAEPKEHTYRISVITRDDAGHMVTAAWDGRIIVWDPMNASVVKVIDDHKSGVYLVRFGGGVILTGDEEGTLHVRNPETWEVLHSLRLPAASHASNAWLGRDGQTIVTSSPDGLLQIWHAQSGSLLRSIDTTAEGKSFDADMNGDGLVATASLRQIDLWRPYDGADWRILAGGDHSDTAFDQGALSRDGKRLAIPRQARDRSHVMRVWDTATGALVGSWPEDGNPYATAISPDGTRVVTGDMDSGPPHLRDAATGALLASLVGHTKLVVDLDWSSDGEWIATASYDQSVRLWRAKDGGVTSPIISPPAWPTAVAFDPAGTRLAVADEDGGVTLYDRRSGAQLDRFAAHASWIDDIAWSADGKRIVTAGRQDHIAKVWDLDHRGAPLVLHHSDNVIRAKFSRDGVLVATTAVDETACVWDAGTGELLRTFLGPDQTALFSPDGKLLYGAGGRDLVAAWTLDVDDRAGTAIAAELEAKSPWRLSRGRLVVKEPVGP